MNKKQVQFTILFLFFFFFLSYLIYRILSKTYFQITYSEKWFQNFLRQRSPLCLNYLPIFESDFWNNSLTSNSNFNNCYAYAFRNRDLNRNHKPQPGEISNKNVIPPEEYTCSRLWENIISDHPGTIEWNLDVPCPCGYSKAHLVLSKNPPDYHFLREDRNGFWSHKLGEGLATQYDASFQFIINPEKANLNFPNFNYNQHCKTFCIPYTRDESVA